MLSSSNVCLNRRSVLDQHGVEERGAAHSIREQLKEIEIGVT